MCCDTDRTRLLFGDLLSLRRAKVWERDLYIMMKNSSHDRSSACNYRIILQATRGHWICQRKNFNRLWSDTQRKPFLQKQLVPKNPCRVTREPGGHLTWEVVQVPVSHTLPDFTGKLIRPGASTDTAQHQTQGGSHTWSALCSHPGSHHCTLKCTAVTGDLATLRKPSCHALGG